MTGRGWSRYVAIGGSFTAGMCDEDAARPSGYAGYADRLAARLTRDARWARRYVAPWVRRRLRGELSGDRLEPQRPDVTRYG